MDYEMLLDGGLQNVPQAPKPAAVGDDDTVVVSSGSTRTIHSGTSLTNVLIENGGTLVLSQGLVEEVEILSGGRITDGYYAGVARDITVNSGAQLYGFTYIGEDPLKIDSAADYSIRAEFSSMAVHNGWTGNIGYDGSGTDLIVHSGGHLGIYNYGIAENVEIQAGGTAFSYSGGTLSSATVSSGATVVLSQGGASDVTLLSGGRIIDGYYGGYAEDTTIYSGGRIYGFLYEGEASILLASARDGYIRDEFSSAVIENGYIGNVGNSGYVSDLRILQGGELGVYANGVTEGTTISSGASAIVYEAGTMSDTIIKKGGALILSQGHASDVIIQSGGVLTDGYYAGRATNITISSGGRIYGYVYKGAQAMVISSAGNYGIYTNFSSAHISSGYTGEVNSNGYVTDITVRQAGAMAVYNKGLSERVTVSSGAAIYVNSGGTASDTILLKGGEMILSQGYASKVEVRSGASLQDGYYGGHASDITVSSGGRVYGFRYLGYEAAVVDYISSGCIRADFSNVAIDSGWNGRVGSGGHVDTVDVNYKGNLYAAYGGLATNVNVDSGASAHADYNGRIENVIVSSGGTLYVSSGTVGGEIRFESGAYYNTSRATLDFTLEGRTAADGALLTNGSNFLKAVSWIDISVTADQQSGVYSLANGITDFTATVDLILDGTDIGDLSIAGGVLNTEYGSYALSISSGMLQLTVQSTYVPPPPDDPVSSGAQRNDVNGDGIADIVMINSQNMAGVWLMGADGSSKWLELSGLPGTWDLFVAGNLNGDQYADILLYDDTNKDIGAWYVDAQGVPHWASLGRISADTTLIAANDFNGDGLVDMAFRKTDGTITVQNNGGSSWAMALPKEWEVAATGDIDGDGAADFIFRNGTSVASWIVKDAAPSWNNISTLNASAQVIATGDFNGDGTDDILINTNGSIGAWIMENGKVSSWKALGSYADTVKFESIGDYNGDGIDDIRVRDVNDLAAIYSYDDSYGWKKFGSVPSDWRTQIPAEKEAVETALRNDINGDGIADIAMIQAGTDAGAWLMDANGGSKWLGLSGLPGTWTLFDVQNVDGNKYADIILYDDTNKDVGLWLMDAKGVPTWQSGGKIAADATLLSAGDWNGDGIADLIYRKSNGTIGFKYLNGGANKEVGLSNDWDVVGTGDINGDGCDDIILRNGNAMGAWMMSASGPTWQSLSGVSSDNQVIGLGDFNGDGTDDVLFNTNGSLGAWLMKDGQVIGWRAFATFPASVTVESISDYNGDGTDDLRVRNGNDLAAVYSYTDGSVEWKKFGSVPGNWTTALAGNA